MISIADSADFRTWNSQFATDEAAIKAAWDEVKAMRRDVPEGCTLTAVHTGDGWALEVSFPEKHERHGEAVAMLAWPESWPEWVDTDFLTKAGFEVT